MAASSQVRWEHLREVPITGLRPGDSWISLAPFTVCSVSPDGRRVRGWSWQQPTGVVWTVNALDGKTVTATSDAGVTLTEPLRDGWRVLQIAREG